MQKQNEAWDRCLNKGGESVRKMWEMRTGARGRSRQAGELPLSYIFYIYELRCDLNDDWIIILIIMLQKANYNKLAVRMVCCWAVIASVGVTGKRGTMRRGDERCNGRLCRDLWTLWSVPDGDTETISSAETGIATITHYSHITCKPANCQSRHRSSWQAALRTAPAIL